MVPTFSDNDMSATDCRQNAVVDLTTSKIVTAIQATVGYDRQLNFRKIAPPKWSSDSSVLLWKVEGKWSPNALVLIKIDKGKETWQIDLLKAGQNEILARMRQAEPNKYKLAKESNSGNGSAYPDGFTVDVYTDNDNSSTVSLPLIVHVDLSSNPKGIPNKLTLEAYFDASVDTNGEFVVKNFQVGSRNHF